MQFAPGDTLRVRMDSAPYGKSKTAAFRPGTHETSFTVHTPPNDTVPAPFDFPDHEGIELGEDIVDTLRLTDFDSPIIVSADNCLLAVDGYLPYREQITIESSNQIYLQITAPNREGETLVCTIIACGVSDTVRVNTTETPSTSSGGGGGGVLDRVSLLLLCLVSLLQYQLRRRNVRQP